MTSDSNSNTEHQKTMQQCLQMLRELRIYPAKLSVKLKSRLKTSADMPNLNFLSCSLSCPRKHLEDTLHQNGGMDQEGRTQGPGNQRAWGHIQMTAMLQDWETRSPQRSCRMKGSRGNVFRKKNGPDGSQKKLNS